ncbi:glycosyltransferase family 25 protein [Pseudomonas entomophila]|uniref:glycosyltransferase family 25 protein n=1 Tax=Pseudomonas entomophila TaxID=312306 RepID=UPI0023D8720B|nr:glycosyltransferase family 25 protein [Pseudomonas entomophila]MDF0729807.1 glycosyltransferase family 25 protein [Pseudomonas entomophila]
MPKAKDLSRLAIDGVFCISLKERSDRRELLLKEFEGSGLDIEFLLVERDSQGPECGCFTSHVECARLALERGYRRVLILEDDATLVTFNPSQVQQINTFLDRRDPELFYLGANLGKVWLTWNRGIARVRTKGAHAYILSVRGCQRMLEHAPYQGIAIDKVMSRQFKAYMAFPMISQQQPEAMASSDIRHARSTDGTFPDEVFWRKNWRKQYSQVLKNLGKTVTFRDL